MKRACKIVLVSCFLLVSTAVYTYANSEEHLVGWYQQYFYQADKLEKIFKGENERLQKAVIEQEKLATNDGAEEIIVMQEEVTANSIMSVENYHQAYLSRLSETENKLEKNNFKAFSEKRKESIGLEISQDVEAYLNELLAE